MSAKILLIEDENLILEMYQRVLTKHGYEVETSANGMDALDKLNNPEQKYDLILLDIMMPKLDGISLLKKIKHNDSKVKNIPVIMLTNLGQENLLKESLAIGAAKYIIKSSILPLEIVGEIDKFLNRNNISPTQTS